MCGSNPLQMSWVAWHRASRMWMELTPFISFPEVLSLMDAQSCMDTFLLTIGHKKKIDHWWQSNRLSMAGSHTNCHFNEGKGTHQFNNLHMWNKILWHGCQNFLPQYTLWSFLIHAAPTWSHPRENPFQIQVTLYCWQWICLHWNPDWNIWMTPSRIACQ